MDCLELKNKSYQLRKIILKMINTAGTGHPGGSLSTIDIMTVLYYGVMNINPKEPLWDNRDRFILSKGHACPALYAILSDLGFFNKEELNNLRQIDAMLQGHPNRLTTPGVEVNSGSLGQGLSQGVGIALGARHQKKAFRTYVVLGDGELQEGQVWEAAMSAGNYRLNNLCAIVDYNRLQGEGFVGDVMSLEPLSEKWMAFNWNVININGHDFNEISDAFEASKLKTDKPTVIIADTIKGKGVSFMENIPKWHGSLAPTDDELMAAIEELDNIILSLGGRFK